MIASTETQAGHGTQEEGQNRFVLRVIDIDVETVHTQEAREGVEHINRAGEVGPDVNGFIVEGEDGLPERRREGEGKGTDCKMVNSLPHFFHPCVLVYHSHATIQHYKLTCLALSSPLPLPPLLTARQFRTENPTRYPTLICGTCWKAGACFTCRTGGQPQHPRRRDGGGMAGWEEGGAST